MIINSLLNPPPRLLGIDALLRPRSGADGLSAGCTPNAPPRPRSRADGLILVLIICPLAATARTVSMEAEEEAVVAIGDAGMMGMVVPGDVPTTYRV